MSMKSVQKLHPVMFAGTGSDVGKSVIVTGFCRIFLQDGHHPAPFKAQNMSLNSFATPDGMEIGRAQAVQAEAAGIPCHTDMNPLLLKPTSDQSSQVVLNGKPIGSQTAREYFRKEGRDVLRQEVHNAFDRLEKQYNPIVLEGAGSVSEINLRELDLVNLPMAIHARADVILVADIDRGGVFASVYGSILLMTEEERKHTKGILINKFRGDVSIFESGVKMLEELCKIPVLGVIPYFRDIHIEEEDSLTLQTKNSQATHGKINIVVILLRHLSNFTDFHILERDPRVHLYYSNDAKDIAQADIILIPGSKNTISDLCELRRNGVAQNIVSAYEKGTTVMGICGGYQMLGREVCDPHQIEGQIERFAGLCLLPITTEIQSEKVTRQVQFTFLDSKDLCNGYEIHMGKTVPIHGIEYNSLNTLTDGTNDGFYLNHKCFGTYIHGILDNSAFIDFLLRSHTTELADKPFDYKAYKEEQYNKLADHIRSHVNMNLLYEILTK
ncbi:unnamed protein product [Adineta ricciae]|uniref:Cobyric acid synthase n=1 Tax=Adineta ricciae TaxID=249248 RepID=A0A815AJD7_ADIRI|nr:unnamed protein product [Adineta ricciae]CAF1260340.1 unnamed protein product [Adineta ricciae]